MGTQGLYSAPGGSPRVCRDCGVDVTGYRQYCESHRDLRRILTFLHQARLIADTSSVYEATLAGSIARLIAKAEALR